MESKPIELLTELAYQRWAAHRSQQYWISSEPLYAQLDKAEQDWWKDFISGIKNSFKAPLSIDAAR